MRFAAAVIVALAMLPTPAQAQGAFGVGGRFSFIRSDVDVDADSQRFMGGQIRAKMSPKTALELSLDVRTDTNEAETVRVRQVPIQASLLLFPVRTTFAPYVLGGGGWYSNRVEELVDDEAVSSVSTREFGWHGGFGAELRLGNHAGVHADYRYTFLKFGDDEDEDDADEDDDSSLLTRFLPSYRGSMWTAGLTIYF
jgi:hypothetical protein